MANPFPFTAGQVLTAAQLNGIGETLSYTPTWTGLTVGNGTVDFEYARVQNLIYVHGKLTFGSTTSITSNPIRLSPPVNADTSVTGANICGMATMQDTGTGTYPGFVYQNATNLFGIYASAANGTYLGLLTETSSTIPFTWTTNDVLFVSFIYEAA